MKKKLIILSITIIIFIGIVWLSNTNVSSDNFIIKEISNSHIQVENSSGETKNITIPSITSKLLIVDKEYRISFEKKSWSKKLKLVKIEPITSSQ